MVYSGGQREELFARLEKYSKFSASELENSKAHITLNSYLTLPVHCGAFVGPDFAETPLYRPNGRQYTLMDVPFKEVMAGVTDKINRDLPRDERERVFYAVMKGMPGYKSLELDLKQACNPRKKPQYEFSASRATSRAEKSNAQILDDLASAGGLDAQTATSIGNQIALWDSMDDEGNGGLMTFAGGVTGGRLAVDDRYRPHTFEDVPNHYFRDRIMDYINTELQKSKRKAAKKAVFTDLTPEEIEGYFELISAECDEELAVVSAPIIPETKTKGKAQKKKRKYGAGSTGGNRPARTAIYVDDGVDDDEVAEADALAASPGGKRNALVERDTNSNELYQLDIEEMLKAQSHKRPRRSGLLVDQSLMLDKAPNITTLYTIRYIVR